MKFLTLFFLTIILFFSATASSLVNNPTTTNKVDSTDSFRNLPPSIKLHHYVTKYCDIYGVPYNIAFGVAFKETGYRGPKHIAYNPKQTSSAKAYGAFQIQVPTANDIVPDSILNLFLVNYKRVTKDVLLNNLELNVAMGIKFLADLKKQYKSWPVALGRYNTGRPIVNKYATRIANFDTQKHFICPKSKTTNQL